MTTYDRPVKATLHVHLENGESWEATPDDLERFGLVRRHDAYATFDDALGEVLMQAGLISRDITDARLNPVRYFVETAIVNPELLFHREHDGWPSVVEIERLLQRHEPEEGTR